MVKVSGSYSSNPWNSWLVRGMLKVCWTTNLNHQVTLDWYMRVVSFPWLGLSPPGTWMSPANYVRTTPGHVYIDLWRVSRYHSPEMPKKNIDIVRFLVGVPPGWSLSNSCIVQQGFTRTLLYIPIKNAVAPCARNVSILDIYYKRFKQSIPDI